MKATVLISTTIGAHGVIERTFKEMKILFPHLIITKTTTGGWFEKQHRVTAEGLDHEVDLWVKATRQWCRRMEG